MNSSEETTVFALYTGSVTTEQSAMASARDGLYLEHEHSSPLPHVISEDTLL